MNLIKTEEIRKRLSMPLPGWQAQRLMAPSYREEEMAAAMERMPDAAKSAVLILLVEKNGDLYVPFIKRAVYQGVHSGQISLPGGRFDTGDKDVLATALRETEEEIGIDRRIPVVLGSLSPLYIPPSNFMVYPFVAAFSGTPVYKKDDNEVREIVEIPLKAFFEKDNISEKTFESSSTGKQKNAPYFNVGGLEIWGATAMIISEFIEIIR
jgi:8-oxo-dGTP pyrophosphatase MutT (NUDIX family)